MGEQRIADEPRPDVAPAQDWPLRPWLLGGMLAVAGLLIHFASDGHDNDAGRMALTAFLFFGPLAAAFSLERDRWKEAALFALAAGLVMAGLAWRAIHGMEHYAAPEYGFFAGVFALLLALPLFQAGFHRNRFATPYRDTHFFVWTDAVSGAGALAFTGLTFLLLFLLAELFQLIQIDLLRDLMEEEWFGWTVAGLAFGTALGTLRNQLKVIGTLQSVVLLVLSLLAVPLALALIVFLLAVAFSGLDVLWEATRSATPVLLACAAGCFILANAIVREDDTDMTRNVVMRITAFVLAVGILPLTVFAAISMGTRIAQYGLAPERLWGLVAIAVAVAYGLATWGAAIRGRVRNWRPYLRRANMNLAVGVSGFALCLALPILDFGAISVSSQVSRLESGKVAAKEFDFDALKWDFGDAGRKALAKLAKSGNAEVAKLAAEAQARKERPWRWAEEPEAKDSRMANLRVQTDDPALEARIREEIAQQPGRCEQPCVAIDMGPFGKRARQVKLVQGTYVYDFYFPLNDEGTAEGEPPVVTLKLETGPDPSALKPNSTVEIRPWQGRRIYVDGKPVGEPFE